MSASFFSGYVVLVSTFLITCVFLESTFSLHVTNIAARSNSNCKEVLKTKDLSSECPSIGSYPIAGHCDLFARCFERGNGVLDSEAAFCADGQIFLVNRCVKSNNLDECPQKHCFGEWQSDMTASKSTSRPIFSQPTTTTTPKTWRPRPAIVTKRPILQNLHPSLTNINDGVRVNHSRLLTLFTAFTVASFTMALEILI